MVAKRKMSCFAKDDNAIFVSQKRLKTSAINRVQFLRNSQFRKLLFLLQLRLRLVEWNWIDNNKNTNDKSEQLTLDEEEVVWGLWGLMNFDLLEVKVRFLQLVINIHLYSTRQQMYEWG